MHIAFVVKCLSIIIIKTCLDRQLQLLKPHKAYHFMKTLLHTCAQEYEGTICLGEREAPRRKSVHSVLKCDPTFLQSMSNLTLPHMKG